MCYKLHSLTVFVVAHNCQIIQDLTWNDYGRVLAVVALHGCRQDLTLRCTFQAFMAPQHSFKRGFFVRGFDIPAISVIILGFVSYLCVVFRRLIPLFRVEADFRLVGMCLGI